MTRRPYSPPRLTRLEGSDPRVRAMRAESLAGRLGIPGNGLVLHTCPACGSHTAGRPPVTCWACANEPYREVYGLTWTREQWRLHRLTRAPRTWRVTVKRGGAQWSYVLFSKNARAACLHWRALGARARARAV